MKIFGRWRWAVGILAAALAVAAADAATRGAELRIGDPAPDFTVSTLSNPGDYAALGLDRKEGPVRLADIPGDVLVFETFNRFCLSCWGQSFNLQSFWKQVEEEGLGGRVRVLATGIGNDAAGVLQFREEHKLTYPTAPDPSFTALDAFGDLGGAPTTYFLYKKEGRWMVGDFHVGVEGTLEMMTRVRTFLDGRAATLTEAGMGAEVPVRPEPPELSPEKEAEHARELFRRVTDKETAARLVEGVTGMRIYRAVGEDGKELDLYARVARRRPVCDLCHVNLFAFAFNKAGEVKGFLPLYVTKVGNVLWEEKDTSKFAGRLAGRKMGELAFDDGVDAVTGATMSSSLIYDEVRRTAKTLDTL